ncbi:hypothetical protein AAG570_003761 [Ranatra chinensis]|uniref:tRNA-intron lyase n=1 Tax=Ranatra chinensis TaxID=642074 RepID=A0ABD0Y4K0_9HEMI
MELKEAIKKKRQGYIKIPDRPPFPIIIHDVPEILINSDIWVVYAGQFNGCSVIISDPDDMVAIHTMGFFGKGSLSRSYPSFGKTKSGIVYLKESQWQRRKEWSEAILGKTKECPGTKSTKHLEKMEINETSDINTSRECFQLDSKDLNPNLRVQVYETIGGEKDMDGVSDEGSKKSDNINSKGDDDLISGKVDNNQGPDMNSSVEKMEESESQVKTGGEGIEVTEKLVSVISEAKEDTIVGDEGNKEEGNSADQSSGPASEWVDIDRDNRPKSSEHEMVVEATDKLAPEGSKIKEDAHTENKGGKEIGNNGDQSSTVPETIAINEESVPKFFEGEDAQGKKVVESEENSASQMSQIKEHTPAEDKKSKEDESSDDQSSLPVPETIVINEDSLPKPSEGEDRGEKDESQVIDIMDDRSADSQDVIYIPKRENERTTRSEKRKFEKGTTKDSTNQVKVPRLGNEEGGMLLLPCSRADVAINITLDRSISSIGNSNSLRSVNEMDIPSEEGIHILVLPDDIINNEDLGSKGQLKIDDIQVRLEKPNLVPVYENLQLTLEEAFFLTWALGCLEVADTMGNYMSPVTMWRVFKESKEDFVEKYVAYHYFRSKGWVVKPGLKFGGDFLLYKKGPPFYHASYIVVVDVMNSSFKRSTSEDNKRKFSWMYISSLNRLAESAKKEILMCQIKWPDVSDDEMKSPEVLKKFAVNESLFRRWLPSQERLGHIEQDNGSS